MLNTLSSTMHLNAIDNVVIARSEIPEGTTLPDRGVTAVRRIPRGHKMAIVALAKGSAILRYGQVIGFASVDIAAGDHVHVHNCEIHDFARDHAFGVDARPTEYIQPQATFQGIARADGRVATRNYIGVLTSVNCSAGTARYVAEAFRGNPITGDRGLLADYPNVDGVVALTHKTGCGMGIIGDGMDTLRRTIAGYAQHVNFAAVLIIGLGCEANQIGPLLATQKLTPGADALLPGDPGERRRPQDRGSRHRPGPRAAARRQCRGAGDGPGVEPAGRPAMRRFRQFLGPHRQPGAWLRVRSDRAPWRHRRSDRDHRDLWRRASADAARGSAPRSRRSSSTG